MLPYTEKYTEFESDIQNNGLLHKIDQQCQNTFEMLEIKKNETYQQNQIYILLYL